ncbi:MAG: hypothetical protein IJP33_02525 [Firmicutes bacterium]|nr:hypothetical protein [Bacillota bacterium]
MSQTNHSNMDLSMQEDFISAFGAADTVQNSEEELFADADFFSMQEDEQIELPKNLFEDDNETDFSMAGKELSAQDHEQELISAKFLGNDIQLPKKEMHALAESLGISVDNCIRLFQKGMNYDRMQKRLQGQNEDKNIAVPPSLSKEQIKENEGQMSLPPKQGKLPRYDNNENSRTERRASWQDALQLYPEFKPEQLSPEELTRINNGENPLNVLQQREIEELRQKLVMAEQKKKSSARALGSVKSDAAEEMDEFLTGFLSV